MNTLTLAQAIKSIQYDSSWGIYAEKIDGQFRADSPARYGQRQFENGGVLDECEFVMDGVRAGDEIASQLEDVEEDMRDEMLDEAVAFILDELNA